MKKIITSIAILAITFASAQAFDGYGDKKSSFSGNFQKGGIGLTATWEYGYTDYISIGTSMSYIISSDKSKFILPDEDGIIVEPEDAFIEKIDFNARIDGHLGKVMGMGEMSDVYLGAKLSFRNVGVQTGFRYLFTDTFGLFAEASVPVYAFNKSYDFGENIYPFYQQFAFNLGIVFSK